MKAARTPAGLRPSPEGRREVQTPTLCIRAKETATKW